MQYTSRTDINFLREKYQYIIGWGAGVEFKKLYNNKDYLDYMIDKNARKNNIAGDIINGISISDPSDIRDVFTEKSVLVVIYPNIEDNILLDINDYFSKEVDTIVGRLVDCGEEMHSYSSGLEDLIMMEIIESMKLQDFSYLDIGVCHPVIRNNTFLFYEKGFTNGILVEPNVSMCNLISEYRTHNKLLNCGVSGKDKEGQLNYYYDPIHPGLNTFCEEIAKERGMGKSITVPTIDVNHIIGENFDHYPNVLDLDTEGMDYELLSEVDFSKYPIDIVCVETDGDKKFDELMNNRGYVVYKKTKENTIYTRK